MLPINHLEKANTTDNLWIYILTLLEERPLYGWEIPQLIEKNLVFVRAK